MKYEELTNVKTNINIEEVRYVKEAVYNFLKGFNYCFTQYDDFVEFHDAVVDNNIDLDKMAEYLYYENNFSWVNINVFKKLILECVPSLEYALEGKSSENEVFIKHVEVENGTEMFFKEDMFKAYPIKTRTVFEIVGQEIEEGRLFKNYIYYNDILIGEVITDVKDIDVDIAVQTVNIVPFDLKDFCINPDDVDYKKFNLRLV